MKNTNQTKSVRVILNSHDKTHINDEEIKALLEVIEVVEPPVHVEDTPESCGNEIQQTVLGSNVPEGPNTTGEVVEVKFDNSASIAPTLHVEGTENQNLLAVNNPLMVEISAFSTGLVIVKVSDAALLPSARAVFGALALEKSAVLGIPMPKTAMTVHSLISGSPRDIEQSQVFAKANASSTSEEISLKVCRAQGRLDWASKEGLHVLSPFIEEAKDGWLIIEQVIAGPITAEIAQALIRIGNLAKKIGTWIMFLIVCTQEPKKSLFGEICDEYIEIDPCEPEVGAVMAFSVDCVGIHDLNSLGIGKTICSIQFSDGGFHHRFDPFISSNLETRVMWTMRGQGMRLDDIGAQFKKHKTSVMRRLQDLPKPRQLDLPKDWLSNNLEMFSVPSRSAKSKADGDIDGDDSDGETPAEGLVKALRR